MAINCAAAEIAKGTYDASAHSKDFCWKNRLFLGAAISLSICLSIDCYFYD